MTDFDVESVRWDFSSFGYSDTECAVFKNDLNHLKVLCLDFLFTYKGQLKTRLAMALIDLEKIHILRSSLEGFASLTRSVRLNDRSYMDWYNSFREELNSFTSKTLTFFGIEVATLDVEIYAKLLLCPVAKRHQSFLESHRIRRPYLLSEVEEQAIAIAEEKGPAKKVSDYDARFGALTFEYKDNLLNVGQIQAMMTNHERDVREKAQRLLNDGLTDHGVVALAVDASNSRYSFKNEVDDKRGYTHVMQDQNLNNNVSDAAVEALHQAGFSAGKYWCKRAYTLKKKLLGISEPLAWWDRSAPLPFASKKRINWSECKYIVLDAFEQFSPTMTSLAENAFDNHWIDAPSFQGKVNIAFSHPASVTTHPYILLNYQGTLSDVLTTAHELGHAIHSFLAGQALGQTLSQTPLTLAETASIFSEMLVFQYLLKRVETPADKLSLLMHKISDILNTTCRQISLSRYEQLVHNAHKNSGDLSSEQFSKFWIQATSEMYGDEGEVFHFRHMENLWAGVGHFLRVPFYVYAYAYADLLVYSLYAAYTEKPEGFESKFLNALRMAGTMKDVDLFAPFNLNLEDPLFWENGFSGGLGNMVEEAEGIARELGYAV